MSERALLDAVFSGRASLADRVDKHMEARFPSSAPGRASRRSAPRCTTRTRCWWSTTETRWAC
ncbi:hypothetical protein NKG05_20120 [Oerskovia sp. M15]